MEAIKTYKTATKKLEIFYDQNAESPREWDNFCQCIFTGKWKHLGDKHSIEFNGGYSDRNDFIERGEAEVRKAIKDVVICKSVHLYSHSGETISTNLEGQYADRWDSGTIGFIVITKDAIRENYGVKNVTKKHIEKAEKHIGYEIETLDQYIRGEVFGFKLIDIETGNEDDACWGFYGDDNKTSGIIEHINDEELIALVLAD